MTTTEAIRRIDDVPNELRLLVDSLRAGCRDVGQQYNGLLQVGGQREDAAAALLALVKPELRAIVAKAELFLKRIEEWEADPFGTGCRIVDPPHGNVFCDGCKRHIPQDRLFSVTPSHGHYCEACRPFDCLDLSPAGQAEFRRQSAAYTADPARDSLHPEGL